MKRSYFIISLILFFLVTIKLFFSFDDIRFSPINKYVGPGVIFFYLTYIMDAFLYFYYLKNTHLSKKIRHVLITFIRCALALILFFHQIILESWYG